MLGKQRITPLLFCWLKFLQREERFMIITIRSQATGEDRAQLMALLCHITGSQRPIATTQIDASEVIALDHTLLDTHTSMLISQQRVFKVLSYESPLPLTDVYRLTYNCYRGRKQQHSAITHNGKLKMLSELVSRQFSFYYWFSPPA